MAMIDKTHRNIPLSLQASLLNINRSSLYYNPHPPGEEDIAIKAVIDRIYTQHPEFGYRRITVWLKKYEGITINHKATIRHMREMGIQAVYPRPNLSKPNPANEVYPYLLSGLAITAPNHVWSIDITYIPIRRSWLYLVAIMDWYSRYVLSWELSDTLEAGFVIKALKRALSIALPEICNSDQGSQYTSLDYISVLKENGVKISMDGRGRCMDNIFTERLWRSLKYQEVYLKEYESPRCARTGITRYFELYNTFRPHQGLDGLTPHEVYFGYAVYTEQDDTFMF
jgi:putative transposase